MAAAPRPTVSRRPPEVTPVPAFFLYGERLQAPNERLIHVETIAARSRLHDWKIRPHLHRELHQVLLLRRGRVRARLDGEVHAPRAPAQIIVPPGVVHAFEFQSGTIGLVVSFAPALARELAAVSPGLLDVLEQPAAAALDRQALAATDLWVLGGMLLREFGRSAPGRHTALRGLLGALLANVLRLAGSSSAPDNSAALPARELVARFRQAIEQRFRSHAAVSAYATLLATSVSRLRRACLTVTGQSPVELLHLRVLVEAERLLRYTSMPVTQVAYHLGFEDPAYFSRFFSRRMAVSPRVFRARDGLATREAGG